MNEKTDIYFAGTRIEKRRWGKSQLATRLEMSSSNLYKISKELEEQFRELPRYNRRDKHYYPAEIRMILKYLGYTE